MRGACGGALPARLSALGPRSRAPRVAIALALLGATAFVLIGDLSVIASVTNLAIYLVFIAVNCAVIILRFTQPTLERPFRTPLQLRRVPRAYDGPPPPGPVHVVHHDGRRALRADPGY